MTNTNLTRLIALAALIGGLLAGIVQVSQAAAGTEGVSLTDIKISFKLDQRLTRGQYMGDLWVSPPTYTRLQDGKELIVEARVEGVDVKGTLMEISPTWTPSDPDMVAVSPGQGKEVKITVKYAGQSSLEVASRGVTKKLSIKATAIHEGKVLQVEITQ